MRFSFFFLVMICFSSLAWAQKKTNVVPSETPVEKPAPIKPKSKGRWGFGVGYIPSRNNLFFSKGAYKSTLTNESVKTRFELDRGPTIDVSYLKASPNEWGYGAGLIYMFKRNITETQVEGNTINSTGSGSGGIQITTLHASGNYSFGNSIIPVGINYSIFQIDDDSGSKVEVNNQIGYQTGVYSYLNRNWLVGMDLLIQKVSLKSTSPSGTVMTLDDGTHLNATISFRYFLD